MVVVLVRLDPRSNGSQKACVDGVGVCEANRLECETFLSLQRRSGSAWLQWIDLQSPKPKALTVKH